MTDSPQTAENQAAKNQAAQNQAAQNQTAAPSDALEARRYGFPVIHGHEVCALRTLAPEDPESPEPGRVQLVRWRRGSGALVRDLPVIRLYVWARAGRISFGSKDGRTIDLVLLGEPESEDLKLGAPWPPRHDRARTASNVAHGVVSDLRNAVTFPASFPRMMRISGERNAVLDSIVAWCQRELPDLHVMRGWLRSSEGPTRHQVSGTTHKGLIGEPGWRPDTVGARPAGWSPFRNDRNAESRAARRKAHEHPSGA